MCSLVYGMRKKHLQELLDFFESHVGKKLYTGAGVLIDSKGVATIADTRRKQLTI